MVETKYKTEKEYKEHLIKDIKIPKKQVDEIWERILVERKKDEYKENREKKEKRFK